MAYHAAADRLSDHQAGLTGDSRPSRVGEQVDHDRTTAHPTALPGHGGEVGSGPQTMRGGQHRRPDQADSSLRPLRRRACRMARPARVRIRRRKPWVLARRRLFGWKVRLLTVWLHHNLRTWCTARAGALGWVDNARPNWGGALVEQHRKWPPNHDGTREFHGTDSPPPRSNRAGPSRRRAESLDNRRGSRIRV